MEFDLEITIDRAAADVFGYVAEVTHLPEWQESALAAEWTERGKRFRERRSFLGRTADLELEVTVSEPPRRFDVQSVGGPVRFEIRHAFEDLGGATRLRITAKAATGGALRLAAGLAKKQAERQFRSDLGRLKSVLERRDEESPSDRPPRLAGE